MSVIDAIPMLLGGEGYEISRSVRLRSSASAYFSRTFSSSGTTATFSAWVKRGALGSASTIFGTTDGSTYDFQITFTASNTIEFYAFRSSAQVFDLITTQVFRDPSAWYHIVAVLNTTNATSSSRVQLYVNGMQVTAFSTAAYPTQNATTPLADSRIFGIGNRGNANNNYFDGYLTEVNFVDGQALTPSSFGETDSITGVWKAKKYAGTYGTNGFFLNFSDNSNNTAATIGKDSSGNGNNWTPNNISVTAGVTYDSMLDVPTMWADGGNVRGNYAVLNPTVAPSGRTTLSAANLQTLGTSSGESGIEYGTIQANSGKWYWECTVLALSTSLTYPAFGVGRTLVNNSNGDAPAYESGGAAIFTGGAVYKESSLVTTVSSYTTNDVIGIALDVDSLTCAFYKNGTLLTTVTSLTAGTYFATVGSYYNSSAAINFGQRPFAYTPPTGFKALNTQNLPDATIKKGGQYFDATTFTATGTTQAVTNSGFQPDFLWFKRRDTVSNNFAFNSVVGDDYYLVPNLTDAEATSTTFISSLNSNGFTMGAGNYANTSSVVCWNWKAGGTAVTNNAGSITSTVSANTTAGFSVVTYISNGTNGATVGHGLGVAPKMVIVKCRYTGTTQAWAVYHASTGATQYLLLNSTATAATSSTYWNNTAPSSTVFTIGTSNDVNISSTVYTYVAYCFSEVAGYSKFGSYTGNGSADGPFVYTGFRPRFVMFKRTDSLGSWLIQDSSRDAYNVNNANLYANISNAEDTGRPVDFVSNGFKIRYSAGDPNVSGGTYIYAAFAENPFKNSLAR